MMAPTMDADVAAASRREEDMCRYLHDEEPSRRIQCFDVSAAAGPDAVGRRRSSFRR
jgi:hypothetical protein